MTGKDGKDGKDEDGKDWLAWHDSYDRPGSRLHQRLGVVQAEIRAALDAQPPGPVRVVSLCAGQGRDLLGVLVDHPRRDDVVARLVEIDPRNVELARAAVRDERFDGVTAVEGDAGVTDAYVGAVPAELVLSCGVFGNVTDADIERTAHALPMLCAPGATVIWTRGGQDDDRLAAVDRWFRAAGFELVRMQTGGGDPPFGVGVHRLVAEPQPLEPGFTMFSFRSDRQPMR
jgi:hypothetical protein